MLLLVSFAIGSLAQPAGNCTCNITASCGPCRDDCGPREWSSDSDASSLGQTSIRLMGARVGSPPPAPSWTQVFTSMVLSGAAYEASVVQDTPTYVINVQDAISDYFADSAFVGKCGFVPPGSAPFAVLWLGQFPINGSPQTNMAYIMSFDVSSDGVLNGGDVTLFVVIKGLDKDPAGIIEGLDAHLVPPKLFNAPQNVSLACGFHTAATNVWNMWDDRSPSPCGVGTAPNLCTMWKYITYVRNTRLLPGNTVNVLVCGHSLGGVLAQIISATLLELVQPADEQLSILPFVSFAAPTVGNPAFVQYILSLFPTARSFVTQQDAIPFVYNNLFGAINLYPPVCPTRTQLGCGIIQCLNQCVNAANATYAQLTRPNHVVVAIPSVNCTNYWSCVATAHSHGRPLSVLGYVWWIYTYLVCY